MSTDNFSPHRDFLPSETNLQSPDVEVSVKNQQYHGLHGRYGLLWHLVTSWSAALWYTVGSV